MNKRKMVLWLVFLGVLLSVPAWPWNPAELPPGIVVETPGSPVELDGETLFFLRVKLKTLSTEQRAKAVSELIKKLAQNPLFDPKTITVQDSELSSDIMVGDKVILPVWEFEAQADGKPAAEVARDYAGRLRLAQVHPQPGPGGPGTFTCKADGSGLFDSGGLYCRARQRNQ